MLKAFAMPVTAVKTVFVIVLCFFASASAAGLNHQRYITIDEIKPGMKAYCLTVFKGVKIEKFSLKVIDVIKNVKAGKDAILVMGTDPRFIHTGPVAGCSGSPVYIDGRLAGALAFGWSFSKDPLYGVTPIEEMLSAGTHIGKEDAAALSSPDFSGPLDLKKAYKQMRQSFQRQGEANLGRASALMCPLSSSLPMTAFENTEKIFNSAGFMPVAAASGWRKEEYKNIKLRPGSVLAIPMVSGDIEMSAIGTVTEAVNGKIYAFGHGMTGQGPVDLPIATGYISTVVASVVRSFKFGQSIETKGALYADESTAIVGQIGRKAKTIPLNITVERFNDKKRVYHCRVISHRLFTPMLTDTCITGTALMKGPLPTDHLIRYKVKIGIEGRKPVEFENFSSAKDLSEVSAQSIGAISLIMNNPYKRVDITSMDFQIEIMPKTAISHIWSFDVSNSTVKPGQEITVQVKIESYLAGIKKYTCRLKIPEDMADGVYTLLVAGTSDYRVFRRKEAPYRYIPENLDSLISIINEIANADNNRLHIVLEMKPAGIAIESAELEGLPISKALLLVNGKRSSRVTPAARWIEKTIKTDTVIIDERNIKITVKK